MSSLKTSTWYHSLHDEAMACLITRELLCLILKYSDHNKSYTIYIIHMFNSCAYQIPQLGGKSSAISLGETRRYPNTSSFQYGSCNDKKIMYFMMMICIQTHNHLLIGPNKPFYDTTAHHGLQCVPWKIIWTVKKTCVMKQAFGITLLLWANIQKNFI